MALNGSERPAIEITFIGGNPRLLDANTLPTKCDNCWWAKISFLYNKRIITMQLEAVFYDHDGTLVDSEIVHYQIWREVLKPFGVLLAVEYYRDYCSGIPTITNSRDLIAHFDLDISAQELTEIKEKAGQNYLSSNRYPLMDGVVESIAFFNRHNIPISVVTGAGRLAVDRSLEKHQLADCFHSVISADDVTHSKPAPDGYLLAIEKLGVNVENCIAIEDTSHGAASAKAAGLDCVVIPNSMSQENVFEHATVVCDSMNDAVKWIADRYQLS